MNFVFGFRVQYSRVDQSTTTRILVGSLRFLPVENRMRSLCLVAYCGACGAFLSRNRSSLSLIEFGTVATRPTQLGLFFQWLCAPPPPSARRPWRRQATPPEGTGPPKSRTARRSGREQKERQAWVSPVCGGHGFENRSQTQNSTRLRTDPKEFQQDFVASTSGNRQTHGAAKAKAWTRPDKAEKTGARLSRIHGPGQGPDKVVASPFLS